MNGHALRELARAWAIVAHDNQSRKGAGEPYFSHVERVAESVWGWRRKTIAYLHDVVEDAQDPLKMMEALEQVFPEDIVEAVMFLTRLELGGHKVKYSDFIEEINNCDDPDAIAVKIADIRDNLQNIRDMPDGQRLEARYVKALARLEFGDPEEEK